METYKRLQAEDLAKAASVEAIFVYNAAMCDQMPPRKLCHIRNYRNKTHNWEKT